MTSPFPTGRWRAQWVWAQRTGHIPEARWGFHHDLDPGYVDQRVLFRRSFQLAQVPSSAPYRITADSRYILYVNGVEISRGPIRHSDRHLHYDHGDAAQTLRPGTNVVAVVARFFGTPTPWWVPAPATETLGGGSLVMELRTGTEWLVTDERWRYCEPTAWTPAPEAARGSVQFTEILDGQQLDPSWNGSDYDDSHWPTVRVIREFGMGGSADARPPSDPFGAILASPLPKPAEHPREAETISVRSCPAFDTASNDVRAALLSLDAFGELHEERLPLHLDPGKTHLVVADFGRIVAGHVVLSTSSEHGGDTTIGALSELLAPEQLEYAGSFKYTTRAGENIYYRQDPAGGRVLALAIQPTGSLRIDRIAVVERLRPRPDGAYFQCADPLLDRIYETGVRTVDLTAQDAYLDCPTREQRAWLGDSVVHQSVDLVTNPDWSLALWNPQLLAAPRSDGLLPMVGAGDFGIPDRLTIPEWNLHWVRSVHNLYRYTGDRDLIAALLPAVELVLRWFTQFLGEDGLLHNVTGWVQIDWSPVPVTGTSASLNALWARALLDFADMTRWQGDTGRARWAGTKHRGVRRGFEVFWDEKRGAYREQILDGVVRPAVTEHAHAAAVCADLVPPHRRPAVLDLLLGRDRMYTRATFLDPAPPPVDDPGARAWLLSPNNPEWDTEHEVLGAQPFYRYVVHDAVAQLGAADRVADLCREWQRLLETGPSAWREVWQGGSYAHGWSSTPTRDLIVYTLGITPGEPGYGSARIAPRLGDLAWARGRVPTPHGWVTVEVDGADLSVDSPVPVTTVDYDGTESRHDAGQVKVRLDSGR